jgi:carbon storage regulator
MLILTRRPQEAIRVGDDVTLTVLGVEGGKVRFGITAPRHISVDREEVYARKHQEGQPPATDPRAGVPEDPAA